MSNEAVPTDLAHQNGATEWFGPVDLPIVEQLRTQLWFELAS